MRAFESITKRATETVSRDLDFGPWLVSINSTYADLSITDAPGLAESASYANGIVQVILGGGDPGGYYETTVTVTATNGLQRSTTIGVTNIGASAGSSTPGTGAPANVFDSLAGGWTDAAPSVRAVSEALDGKAPLSAGITSLERSKLAGIAAGATANATDAQLRSRATHTGTQPIATIDGLQTLLTLIQTQLSSLQTANPAQSRGGVDNQAQMLAVTPISQGDWVVRRDRGTTWALLEEDPTQLSSWFELAYPTSPITSVAGRTGDVVLAKADVGLANVANVAPADLPVSTATALALSGKAASVHGHEIAAVSGLQAALDAKAASAHTHTTANVTGLDSALAGKAATNHNHPTSAVSGLDTALAGKQPTLSVQVNGTPVAGAITTINIVGGGAPTLVGGVLSIDLTGSGGGGGSATNGYVQPGYVQAGYVQ